MGLKARRKPATTTTTNNDRKRRDAASESRATRPANLDDKAPDIGGLYLDIFDG